ncbi:MAG: hypothetical protein BGP16_07190 [Sphingobium sp. 66-54]|nr:MAG: hypothetical protein BGP16_07190 [Sphingobium sp. 66-54]
MGKTKSMLLAAVAAAAFAMPASATLTVNFGGASAPISGVSGTNDFEFDLAALTPSLTHYVTNFSSVIVSDAPVTISVYKMGAESGDTNWVQINGTNYGESNETWALGNIFLTSFDQGNGALGGEIKFTGTGLDGTFYDLVGSGQVAVFLPTGVSGSYSNNSLYFGFNDSGSADGDFDDYVIRITSSPVPEPATWAMMVLGLGLVGAGMRRRRTTVSFV